MTNDFQSHVLEGFQIHFDYYMCDCVLFVIVDSCESLASQMQPWMFDACGLLLLEERGMPWLGDDTVIPSEAWEDVTSFLNDPVGAQPPYLEYEVQVINNCVPECHKEYPEVCTIYDPEYVACASINPNVRVNLSAR